jgi:hypothetical protein
VKGRPTLASAASRDNDGVLGGDHFNEPGTAAQTRAALTATANLLSFFMMLSRLNDNKINK